MGVCGCHFGFYIMVRGNSHVIQGCCTAVGVCGCYFGLGPCAGNKDHVTSSQASKAASIMGGL